MGYCGALPHSFYITTGVKQRCVVTPTLFPIFLIAKVEQLKGRRLQGIDIIYRMGQSIFNIRTLDAWTKTARSVVLEFQYADNSMVCAQSEKVIQVIKNDFVEAYTKIGLTINFKKTRVLHRPISKVCAQSQTSRSKTLLSTMSLISHTREATCRQPPRSIKRSLPHQLYQCKLRKTSPEDL